MQPYRHTHNNLFSKRELRDVFLVEQPAATYVISARWLFFVWNFAWNPSTRNNQIFDRNTQITTFHFSFDFRPSRLLSLSIRLINHRSLNEPNNNSGTFTSCLDLVKKVVMENSGPASCFFLRWFQTEIRNIAHMRLELYSDGLSSLVLCCKMLKQSI